MKLKGTEVLVCAYLNPDTDETIEDKIITGCPLTDTGNAERLIAYHGDNIRYCAERKSWYLWNGVRWVPDVKGAIFEMAKETAIKIHDEIKYLDINDKAARKELSKFAYRSESQKSLREMIQNAQTDARVAIEANKFDAKLELINCPNGTLDLEKEEFREHQREDLLTKLTAVPFDPWAPCALYFPTLIRALPLNEAVYAQLLLGSFLEATAQNKEWLFIYGKPFAMKSSVTQPVYAALGDYAKPFPISLFIKGKQRIDPNAARPELIALEGVRIAWSEEAPPNFIIDEPTLKNMTSSGIQSIRQVYERQREVHLVCSFVVESNGTFTFDIDDEWSREAALERTRVMKFVNQLRAEGRDREVLKTLTHDKHELTAALAWVVQGYFESKKHGITTPGTVKAANSEFEAVINPLSSFVRNELNFGDGYVSVTQILERFHEVASREKIKQFPNERSLNLQLRKILPYYAKKEGVTVEPKKLEGGASWLGVTLKDLDDELIENKEQEDDEKANEERLTLMTQNPIFVESIYDLDCYMRILCKNGILRHKPSYPKGAERLTALKTESDALEAYEIPDAKKDDLEHDLDEFVDVIENIGEEARNE